MAKITGQQLADAAVEKRPDTNKWGPSAPPQITYEQEMCDGFVRNSFKRAGGDMGRYAGSNDMFRNALTVMYPLDMAKKQGIIVPGALLFIVKPGHNDKYNDDLGNASHVGIYTGSPHAEVMHSSESRGGVYPSTLKNAWTHAGLAKAATYGASKPVNTDESEYGGRGGELPMDTEQDHVSYILNRVVLPSQNRGETVNFRKNAQPEGVVYARVPDGTQVFAGPEFTKNGIAWKEVGYNNLTGYMMSQYLEVVNPDEWPPIEPPTDIPSPVPPIHPEDPRYHMSIESRVHLLEMRIDNIEKITGIKLGK